LNIYDSKGRRGRSKGRGNRKKPPIKQIIILLIVLALFLTGASLVNRYIIVPKQNYEAAVALFESESYEEAQEAFAALGDYRDSGVYVEKCTNLISGAEDAEALAKKYKTAVTAMKKGDYKACITLFTAIGNYKSSKKYLKKCKKECEKWGVIEEATVKQFIIVKSSYQVRDKDYRGTPGYTITFGSVEDASGYEIFGLSGDKISDKTILKTDERHFFIDGESTINYLVVRAFKESEYGDTMYGE